MPLVSTCTVSLPPFAQNDLGLTCGGVLAALSDMFSGDTLGLAFAKLGSAAGVGALTGSMLSGRLLSAGVRPTTIFKLTALLGLCQGAIDLYCLQETLPEEKKSTKPLTMPNPLSALRLLEGSRGLKTLVAVAILQCMPEGKNLSDALTVSFAFATRTSVYPCLESHL